MICHGAAISKAVVLRLSEASMLHPWAYTHYFLSILDIYHIKC
jgi:hypothetical protein